MILKRNTIVIDAEGHGDATGAKNSQKIRGGDTVIAIYLYYEDTLNDYLKYVRAIPNEIHLYIISSRESVLDRIRNALEGRANCFFVRKENRGRDVSALLISCKELVSRYKYFCFIHDKKPISDFLQDDTKLWIKNIWDNLLLNKTYIYKILDLLNEGSLKLGMLVPPPPIGLHMNYYFNNVWGRDYEGVLDLKDRIDLNVPISKDDYPISLGNVFWCRAECLKKLFSVEWRYENFNKEPLEKDGTLNHFVERILGYIVIDSGYEVRYVMNSEYAAWQCDIAHYSMYQMFNILKSELHFSNLNEIYDYTPQMDRVEEYARQRKKLYLYGAGEYGKKLLKRMTNMGITPNGFVVSELGYDEDNSLLGYPVELVDNVAKMEGVGIIIAVSEKMVGVLENNLKRLGVNDYICGYEKSNDAIKGVFYGIN